MISLHDIPTSYVTVASGLLGGGLIAELLKGRRTPVQRDAQKVAEAAQDLAKQKEVSEREIAARADHLKLMQTQVQAMGDARDDGRESMKIALDSMQLNIKNLQEQIISHQAQLNDQSKQLGTQRALISSLQDQIESLRQERHELLTQLQNLELLKGHETLRADQAESRLREIQDQKQALSKEIGAKDEVIKKHETTIAYLRAKLSAVAPGEGSQVNNFTFVEPIHEEPKS